MMPPHHGSGFLAIVAAALAAACGGASDPGADEARDAGAAAAEVEAPTGPTCRDRIAALGRGRQAPELERYQREQLPQIVLGAKVEPVLFLRPPQRAQDPEAVALSEQLDGDSWPLRRVRALIRQLRGDKPALRRVLLREGYLFEDRPAVARALVKELTLADLFDEPQLYMHRHGQVVVLARDGDEYRDEDGARVSLLLNDRVAPDPAALDRPLHLDLEEVRAVTGAQRITPLAIGATAAAVGLRYPDATTAQALIEQHGLETVVVCADQPLAETQAAARRAEQFWDWSRAIEAAAERMVVERQLFDEPKDEAEGEQEDGQLRIEWRKAYYRGRRRFSYRDEEYGVYDWRGNPTPPQVCIDFIFDTLERASGTWFKRRGSRPGRTLGFLDFSTFDGFLRRQTPAVLEYAADPETPLERYDIPSDDQVPFRKREQFSLALARHADQILEGDVLVIHGLREEDLERHYHTLLVLRTEPLTGLPMVVADNAGRPRIRTVSSAMRSAPRRSVKHRLRIEPRWIARRLAGLRVGTPDIM